MIGSGANMPVLAAGLASGPALAAYAAWVIRLRKPDGSAEGLPAAYSAAASLINGAGWLLAWVIARDAMEAAALGLMVSAGIVFSIVDLRIRLVPNELVAALLALSAALAVAAGGWAALPGRLVGLLVALTLFLVAMLIAGPGKIGWGDVKLAAAVGFASGFPGALSAVLVMAVAAVLTGVAGMLARKRGLRAPMPYAGFLMAGLVVTLFLDGAGALSVLKWG